MKTIGITKGVRSDISAVAGDGESVNDTISRLLENKKNIIAYEREPNDRTNIHLDEDVLAQLTELKGDPREPYGSVIMRLIEGNR